MSKSIKVGSKWSGKTAASAIGTVGIVDNSDDTILLTNTKGVYKVKEILSKEDFEELLAEETGKKKKGKNPTNRNIARALQNEFNKQSKSHAKVTPNGAAASSTSMTTRRQRPTVAPVKPNKNVVIKLTGESAAEIFIEEYKVESVPLENINKEVAIPAHM